MISHICLLVELGPICNSMAAALCLKSCEDHSLLKSYNGGLWKNIYRSGPWTQRPFGNFWAFAVFSGPPGVLGIWGEWLFIFRELGSTGNYLRGAREQVHNFGDLGSLDKK